MKNLLAVGHLVRSQSKRTFWGVLNTIANK